MGSIPPLDDLFKMAGMNLPSYLKGPQEKSGEVVDVTEKETGKELE